jgi:hypothetical protein
MSVALVAVWLSASPGGGLVAAEMEPKTERAYEIYAAEVTREFQTLVSGERFMWALDDAERRHLLERGEIVAGPADGDGILEVPGGLVHHWIAAVFVPGVRLRAVLNREREYRDYPRVHKPILEAELLDRHGNTDRVRLRLEQRTRFVHAVLDTWWRRVHHHPLRDRAYVMATAERIQQVAEAGTSQEQRLPVGAGGGYLWRANTYMKFIERDGGTYIEFQTLGLSRGFPFLLGWIAEPIVRRIGRGSVERSLEELRADLLGRPSNVSWDPES